MVADKYTEERGDILQEPMYKDCIKNYVKKVTSMRQWRKSSDCFNRFNVLQLIASGEVA